MNINDITDQLEIVAGKIISKGRETKEILSVKSDISTCNNVLDRNYAAIGKKYYEMFTNGDFDPAFEKEMKAIENALNAKKEFEVKLKEIKRNFSDN